MKWEQATGVRPSESLQHTLQKRRPEPRGTEPGAFHCEIANFVDRVDLTQPRAEFKTIENDDSVLKANVLGLQIAVSVNQEALRGAAFKPDRLAASALSIRSTRASATP